MATLRQGSSSKVILFDLDNTLFDHSHSVQSALAAVQKRYEDLKAHDLPDLIARYNNALQQAYDKYLSKEITYEDTEALKIQMFFKDLGLAFPTPEIVQEFRAIYKPAYRANRRATPGSAETLTRLREHGCRLAILTNGQYEDQVAKAEAIGLRYLVDHIFTSEKAGCYKPDPRFFKMALSSICGSECDAYMVGDSIATDIKGALDTGFGAILYSPTAQNFEILVSGKTVPVIRQMSSLLEQLGIKEAKYEPSFDL